jgi:membrane protein
MTFVKLPSARRRVAAGRAWWEQSLYGSGWARVRELDLDTHALALCAQQVLCTAPLIVAISAVLQRTNGRGISWIMAKFFGLSGASQVDMQALFSRQTHSISTLALVFAMITAVVFSTSVGAVQQRAFELIWTLPRTMSVRNYLRQLVWAVALAFFSVGILLLGRVGHWAGSRVHTGAWTAVALQGVLTFLFYWWSQHWLLDGRVTWRSLLPGAVAVGIGTVVLVRLSRLIVPGQISWQVHAYGLVGAVFVLSVWLMVLSAEIFVGVLLGALIVERRTARRRLDPGDDDESPLTVAGLESASSDQLPAVR